MPTFKSRRTGRDLRDAKQDTRPRRRGWAPGNYLCDCHNCHHIFFGDKRAIECADCAYTLTEG